jgi:hypothetical protein
MDDEIEAFFEQFDTAYGEYEQGYADADATLRRVKEHVETLREAAE